MRRKASKRHAHEERTVPRERPYKVVQQDAGLYGKLRQRAFHEPLHGHHERGCSCTSWTVKKKTNDSAWDWEEAGGLVGRLDAVLARKRSGLKIYTIYSTSLGCAHARTRERMGERERGAIYY